jgi:hypothetical protein
MTGPQKRVLPVRFCGHEAIDPFPVGLRPYGIADQDDARPDQGAARLIRHPAGEDQGLLSGRPGRHTGQGENGKTEKQKLICHNDAPICNFQSPIFNLQSFLSFHFPIPGNGNST